MAATMIATTAVVVAAMVAAGGTMAKATVPPRSLCLNLKHNQWRVPVQTVAANALAAVMAKDVVAISNRSVLRRRMLRLSSNNSSQPRANNNRRVNNQTGKLHGHAAMPPAIVRHQPALKISPLFREHENESISDRRPCRLHVSITRSICGGGDGSRRYLDRCNSR